MSTSILIRGDLDNNDVGGRLDVSFSSPLTSTSNRRQQRRQARATLGSGIARVERQMKKLRFGRSRIHAWGVFAEEPIGSGDVVIEYKGELIRHQVADLREEEYERLKCDDYMFRIDANVVVDATRVGSLARFINHSCDPNCRTQIVCENGEKKIFIYAKRDIDVDEELAYEYVHRTTMRLSLSLVTHSQHADIVY